VAPDAREDLGHHLLQFGVALDIETECGRNPLTGEVVRGRAEASRDDHHVGPPGGSADRLRDALEVVTDHDVVEDVDADRC
jgi:hypothetical protein